MKKILVINLNILFFLLLNFNIGYTQINDSFSGEIAFTHLEKILSFGPRITNTEGHEKELNYIETTLKNLGFTVKRLSFKSSIPEFSNLIFTNIYTLPWNSKTAPVKLFGAHLDTLPFCPYDKDPEKRKNPLTGANDGASGVALLLELARITALKNFKGVSFAFFDGEEQSNKIDKMFVGSKHMANHIDLYFKKRKIDYLILVDMIGDKDLQLKKEYHSQKSAPDVVSKIWKCGKIIAPNVFLNKPMVNILDDHIPFIKNYIRAVDLIDFDYPVWHTDGDRINMVSPLSLEKIGKTLSLFLSWDK